MTRAISPETVRDWATGRALDLWVVLGEPVDLTAAAKDGAVVRGGDPADPVAVFSAMRETNVLDVRRVGVVTRSPRGVATARCSGAAAVVAIEGTASAGDLLAAEPDVVVDEAAFAGLYATRYGTTRARRPQVLLNPGPALTSDAVKRAAAGVDLCHREPEYESLERDVREKLRRVADVGPSWGVAFISGSGTLATETALRAATRPGKRALIVVNGVYGERLHAMATRAGIDVVVHERDWTEAADPAVVDELMGAMPEIDVVAIVHHETTTGMLNPVSAIAGVARAHGVRVLVDAVSSFGAEELELEGSGIDFVCCSSNKCLQGLPGAAFVLVSPTGLERIETVPPSSVYLDLAGYLRGAETGSPPFTPPIPAVAALDAALDEVLVRGPEAHRRLYAERAAVLDEVLAGVGLEPIVPPERRSRTVRSVPLPPGVDYTVLHDRLKGEGFVIYAGQGALADSIFRVCCMGTLEPAILRDFGSRLAVALEREPAPA